MPSSTKRCTMAQRSRTAAALRSAAICAAGLLSACVVMPYHTVISRLEEIDAGAATLVWVCLWASCDVDRVLYTFVGADRAACLAAASGQVHRHAGRRLRRRHRHTPH